MLSAAVVIVEVAGVVTIEAAVVVVAVAEADPTLAVTGQTREETLPRQVQAVGAPSILTYPRESGRGALCISAGAGGPFSVVSQPHVLGRMFMPPSLQTNETGTSSVLIKMTL